MSKFFMYSNSGEGAALLLRLREEGNEVRLFIQEKDDRENFKGIINHQPYPTNLDKSWTVIFDISGMGKKADKIRKQGIPVFGASSWADKLEHDRAYGLSMMLECGINIPQTYDFDAPQEWFIAEQFVKENKDKRWVFKPSGEGLPTKLTYCGQDAGDLLEYMHFVRENFNDVTDFILQEFIEGTIVSTEFWSASENGFVYPANHTVETKKLMNDDLGPSIGCSGNLIWCAPISPIVASGVQLAEGLCMENQYCGPIDLNTIISKDGEVYGLEWTPRFGYDALPTILQLIDGEVGELISDVARGQVSKAGFPLKEGFAAGIHLSIPPYPLEPPNTRDVAMVSPNKGIPIRGIKDHSKFFFFEVMMETGILKHSTGTGSIAVVSNYSENVDKVLDTPYEILESIMVPDKQYRTDLGAVLPKMYEKVNQL